MITIENYLGTINISNEYLVSLISHTASGCFGVVAMNPSDKKDFLSILKKDYNNSGVIIKYDNQKLIIGIHISVMFGTKISAVVDSLVHKIRYVVEEKTGLKIAKVTIYVDDMIS